VDVLTKALTAHGHRERRSPGPKRAPVVRIKVVPLLVGVAVAAGGTFATGAPAATAPPTWPHAVTDICAHALLFEGRHEIGTRAGAVAVARDIRSSTERRLARIAALSLPPPQPSLAARWLAVERRLAAVYAHSYLRIFEVIDAANTSRQRAREPRLLQRLLRAPDQLREQAARLELRLGIADCTGGTAGPVPHESADRPVLVRRTISNLPALSTSRRARRELARRSSPRRCPARAARHRPHRSAITETLLPCRLPSMSLP
jgi:hypothetical protein